MMVSTFLIANLSISSNDTYAVCYYDSGASMQSFPAEISGYFYAQVEAARGEGYRDHTRYTKAVKRGYRMAKRFEQLIGFVGRKNVNVTVSPGGLVGGYPMEHHAWATKRIAYFVKTKFDFSASLTPTNIASSTQFLHFSESTPQAVLQSFLDTSSPRSVTILSGICLSSSKTMTTATTDGPIADPKGLEYNRASLYELEYIARSAPAIADLAIASRPAAESAEYHDGKQVCQPVHISLDVPSFHYYQSVDELLRSGRCGFDEALRWLRAIEKHHEQISHIFRGCLNDELLRRDPSAKGCPISVTPGCKRILSSIRESVEKRTHPSVEKAMDTLSVEEPAWTRFMQFVPDKERPKDFGSLGYLFYVYQVVRHAFGNGSEHEPTQPGLLISIDDSAERGVYSRAQKLLKGIRESKTSASPVLLETYLCRRVFVDNNANGSELYFHDLYPRSVCECYNEESKGPSSRSPHTSLELDSSSNGGDIVLKTDPRLFELDPLDVIEKLYGERSATLLRKLCAETGL